MVSVRENDDKGDGWSVDQAQGRFDRTRSDDLSPGFLLYVLLDEIGQRRRCPSGPHSNRINGVMKPMTSWGAILLGASLIAGIYGMNFEHMPELNWRLGYLLAMGLMAVVTIAGHRYFRRKNWL